MLEDGTMCLAEAQSMKNSLAVVSCARPVVVAAIVIIALATSPIETIAQATGACADSTNASTLFYRDYYRIAVSSAESHMVAFRSRTDAGNCPGIGD